MSQPSSDLTPWICGKCGLRILLADKAVSEYTFCPNCGHGIVRTAYSLPDYSAVLMRIAAGIERAAKALEMIGDRMK